MGPNEKKNPETNDNVEQSLKEASSSPPPPPPPPTIKRPLRPIGHHQRRQVMAVPGGQPIELAAVLPPPKRPAHLPATYATRYATLGSPGQHHQKPNRYSWAQLQHWHVAQQQQQQKQQQQQQHQEDQQQPRHQATSHFLPFSTAASRVLVVNPMQIVNLSEHTKSRLIKIIEALKRFSEQWFSHVLLLMFLAVYACFGAYVFISFEASNEQWEKQLIIEMRQQLVNESYGEATNKSRDEFTAMFVSKLEDYERLLSRACQSGMTSSSLENQWTFWGALFYSMTVFTTIGYGHLTPITFAGRVATMVYAIFGIPILLMVLADLGKLLTRIIKFAFKQFRSLYHRLLHRKSSIRTRKMISDNTNQYMGRARRALDRLRDRLRPNNERLVPRWLLMRFTSRPPNANSASNLEETRLGDNDTSTTQMHKEASQVIVTPAKQTKPVSPQPSASNERLKLTPTPSSYAHHHHHHQHQNLHQHHHDKHRSHAPAASTRRKCSLPDKRRTPKGSVSRSSSASLVVQSPTNPASEALGGDQVKAETEADIASGQELGGLSEEAPVAEEEEELCGEGDLEEEEDDFDIPVSFALFLLVTYMMFGAVIFSIWEGWNFFDSLYFVFISMSTIGFGDLVPQHPKRMIGTFIYLLFGLALTSMCINVVQEKIHATFLRAKMQLGEKMGFDLEQIMADDYYDGSLADDEEDSQRSLALSQATGLGDEHLDDGTQAQGVRLSRSSNSLKSKQRRIAAGQVTGLPGHSNALVSGGGGTHSGIGRRSSNKRAPFSRQATPSAPLTPTPDNSNSKTAARSLPASPVAPTMVQAETGGTSKARVEIGPFCLVQQPALARSEVAASGALRLFVRGGLCEPLQVPAAAVSPGKRLRLAAGSQPIDDQLVLLVAPTATSSAVKAPHLVATTRPPQSQQRARLSRTSYHDSMISPSAVAGAAQEDKQRQLSKSASSSRRSSVSQELNQLDDLIQTLGKSAHSADRYGPLLGIPASAGAQQQQRRQSHSAHTSPRSVSPSGRLQASSSNEPTTSSACADQHQHRRATSMTSRHRQRPSLLAPAPGVGLGRRAASSLRIKVPQLESPPSSSQPAPDSPATKLAASESQRAIDELEAVKLSIV